MPDLFADDASFTGNAGAPANGKEALRKMFSASESLTLIPFIHNHLIELSGNRASGTCAVEVRAVQNGVAMTAAGYYSDQYLSIRAILG